MRSHHGTKGSKLKGQRACAGTKCFGCLELEQIIRNTYPTAAIDEQQRQQKVGMCIQGLQ